ncbi:carbon-nitrogen hydrolase family protein [Amaricoccus solimangrovi]|uniref:Carbon-nitrogen hydrolase family protein n=1 Tax=Amaricoccus solimangrovi TaxID=2589815 RepID=A0A501WZN9_9RHOB|nr:carbon-nitrogen hydrolase family protein [Amaricoccus solimangrovi]TPE51616.1 carbon-nitrogen hydrolase family protein [Amaricoccus solimangrovi]
MKTDKTAGSSDDGRPTLRLLACQVAVPETRDAAARGRHLARCAAEVSRRLAEAPEPIDLVVLPELSSIEYSREAFERLDELAEPLDGPSFATWSGVARRHGVTIVYGAAIRGPGGDRITQVVVGPDGARRGAYAKIHTAQFGASMEKEFFVRGETLVVVEVAGFRVAPIICYDIRIPELSRVLCVDQGVDLLLHCGAYAHDLSFYSWHDFVVTRALENQVYMLSLNRAGADFGASMFCAPWVDETAPPENLGAEETFRTFTLTRAALAEAREVYPFLADRLEDYAGLPLALG